MKPILYDGNERLYDTQGLGVLSDAITCYVEEERNGKYELTMTYGIDGIHYSDIKHSRIILAKPNETANPQPFRIYKITTPINGKVTINAEHISYQMSNITVSPFSAQSAAAALTGLISHSSITCPFTFWTDKTTQASFKVTEPSSMRSRLGGVSGSILDVYGGEWEFDGYTARLWNSRGMDRGVVLRYGKNITDLKQEENIANVYTGIHPYWKDSSNDLHIVELPEKYVLNSDTASNFPYSRIIPVDFSDKWETEPTVQQLRDAANSYVQRNRIGIPKVSIKVSFVPLWQSEEYKDIAPLERVYLCDTVTVEFEKLGVKASAKVTKTKYDVLSGRYVEIALGEATSTIASTISNAIDEVKTEVPSYSFLEQSVERATSIITGASGGYVQLLRDAVTGHPEAIAILGDSDDIDQALKVWMWTSGGFGYSETGKNGPYRTAITNDGQINADFITTGNLRADIIKTGHLQDEQGQNYWDMDTGEFRLKSTMVTVEKGDGTTYTDMDSFISDIIDTDMTQTEIFNRLTDNGTVQGITMYNGQLYINASYINSGTIAANYLKLYGVMAVYNALTGNTIAGYVGAGYHNYSVGSGADLINESDYGAALRAQSGYNSYALVCNKDIVLHTEAPSGYPTNGNIVLQCRAIDISGSGEWYVGPGDGTSFNETQTYEATINQGTWSLHLYFKKGIFVGYSTS